MNKNYNPHLKAISQMLRRNMTKEESHLWYDFLKKLPVRFNRQKIIDRYIVDFYCASAKVVIELDGSQHYEIEGKEKDKARDTVLSEKGYIVLRYTNFDIHERFDSVCKDILLHIGIE